MLEAKQDNLPLSVTCPEEGEHALVQSWEGEEGEEGGVWEGKEKKPFSSQNIRSSLRDTSS